MAKKRRREPLVYEHLERISRKLLQIRPEILRVLVGRRSGIYALYRRQKLQGRCQERRRSVIHRSNSI